MAKKKAKRKALRLATIDVGSNAARLFIAERRGRARARTLVDQRAPVRLGADVFRRGEVSGRTLAKLTRALDDFKQICDEHEVDRIVAVGTAALRDAKNARQALTHLRERTGIQLKLIRGTREAELLHTAVRHALNLGRGTALLIDLGGGSLELVISHFGAIERKLSLPVGTVRLLARLGRQPTRARVAAAVHPALDEARGKLARAHPRVMVGTGGNLRALGKLCFKLHFSRSRDRFRQKDLIRLIERLFGLSYRERMARLNLRADRADVILPAAVTVLELMRAFDLDEIRVPDVGLKNGLFWDAVGEG